MDDLPNEILQIIFKKLKLRDLIQCRMVCKRFMFISDDIKIPELIISNQIENIMDLWFAINKPFNHKDAIDITTYKRWRSASTFRLKNIVRRLHFKGTFSDYVQLNLNNLTELEQLKIDLDECCDIKHYIDINLPNLKILEIGNKLGSYIYNVTAPSLEKLKSERFEKNRIEYPSSITYLDVNDYYVTARANALTNLQYLKVRTPRTNILSDLPRLTTLVCNLTAIYSNETKPNLLSIVDEKLTLKRPELKIYFHSVELVDIDKLNEYYLARSTLEYQINNYNSMCDDAYSKRLYYNELMRLFHGRIPDDFFKKYSNTKEICVVGTVESQEHLMRFLKRFDYLIRLDLWKTTLDQRFFDGLHGIRNLIHLTIGHGYTHLITDYNFLFKLKILKTLRIIDRDLPEFFDLALTLYKRLKYFVSFLLYFDGKFFEIKKKKQFLNYRFAQYSFRERRGGRGDFVTDGLDFDQVARMVNEFKNASIF